MNKDTTSLYAGTYYADDGTAYIAEAVLLERGWCAQVSVGSEMASQPAVMQVEQLHTESGDALVEARMFARDMARTHSDSDDDSDSDGGLFILAI